MIAISFLAWSGDVRSGIHSILAEPPGERVTIEAELPFVGRIYLPVIITDEIIFVSVTALFEAAHIYYRQETGLIQGYLNDEHSFHFYLDLQKAVCNSVTIMLTPENSYVSAQHLYMESSALDSLLGIRIEFYFASLNADITSTIELPVVAQARRAKQYKKLSLAKQPHATVIANDHHPLFGLNAIDWAVTSTIHTSYSNISTYRAMIGGRLIGGNYWVAPSGGFGNNLWHSFEWGWQHIADRGIIRQVTIGDRVNLRLPVFGRQFRGIQISNEPVQQSGDFGTYTFKQPLSIGSTLELYQNDQLIAYQLGDSTGQVHMDIPLAYGSSLIVAKEYGPHNEGSSVRRLVQIPKSLVPSGQFRYTISSGVLGSNYTSFLSQAEVSAGLSNNITLSAGAQYYDVGGYEPVVAFARLQSNIFSNLFLVIDYIDRQKLRTSLDYLSAGGLQLQAAYQLASPTKQFGLIEPKEKMSLRMSIPLKIGSTPITIRARASEYAYEFGPRTISGTVATSMSIAAVPLIASLDGHMVPDAKGPNIMNLRTTLQAFFPLFLNARLYAVATYDHSMQTISTVGLSATSRIDNVDITIRLDKGYNASMAVQAGLSIKLPFASILESGSMTASHYSLSNTLQGSLHFGDSPQDISFTADPSVSMGSVVIRPFLDMNRDGLRDSNEPAVFNVDIDGHKKNQHRLAEGAILINFLSPNQTHSFRCITDRLEEPSWQPHYQSFDVSLKSDQTQIIDFPIYPISEISGVVIIKGNKQLLQGYRIVIQDSLGKEFAKLVPETDGSFYYSGLPPGQYFFACETNKVVSAMKFTKPAPILIAPGSIGQSLSDIVLVLESD